MVMLADYVGRLGNRLYLYIHVLAAAMEHGFHLSNLTLAAHAGWFEGLYRNSWCRWPPPARGWPAHRWVRPVRAMAERLVRWQQAHPSLAIPGIAVPATGGGRIVSMEDASFRDMVRKNLLTFPWGWGFRANRLVTRHRESIRSFLALRPGLDPNLEQQLAEIRARGWLQVCLHIRQGDFRTWQGGKFYLPPEKFSWMAHEIVRQNPVKKFHFWVCSDEAVELSPFPPGTWASPGRSLREDFRIMVESDYLLSGGSTLACVAGYLGKGRIQNLRANPAPLARPQEWLPGAQALEDLGR
jgi:hypothetical protein